MHTASAESAVATATGARYALARPASALARALLALVAGALLAAAFAPLNLWPLAVLSPALLMWLWQGATPREAARLGFWFSFATFAAGTYWLYTSIHGFGGAPVWLALLLMLGLVSIMGLYHAGLGYAAARWLPAEGAVRWLVGFAPLAGVYGISALLLVCAGAVTALVCGTGRVRLVALLVLLIPWAAGAALYRHSWTQPSGPPVPVAIVQGAIPQDEKWLASNHEATLRLYRTLTEQVLGTALIVWPESSTADVANDIVPYIDSLYREARAHGSALVMGVL